VTVGMQCEDATELQQEMQQSCNSTCAYVTVGMQCEVQVRPRDAAAMRATGRQQMSARIPSTGRISPDATAHQ
jgi:hypothetical protein